jgi:RNA polymerase sigma-70 factor, ECF subfamily
MSEEKINYENIHNQYYKKIFNYLARTAGYFEAEDLTQEVFIKVHNSLNTFDSKSSAYTWIYRIATNHLIDRMRKKKKIVDRCNLIDKTLFCISTPEYLTEEFKIVQNEMKECICSYIKALPLNYHTIIVLREYESMTIKEIACIMDIKEENAKKMLARAREKLKKILVRQCDFYFNEINQISCEKKS